MDSRDYNLRTVLLVEKLNSTRANIVSNTTDRTLIYKKRLADILNSGLNPTDNKFKFLRRERYGLSKTADTTTIQMINSTPQISCKDILFGFEIKPYEELYVGDIKKRDTFRKKVNMLYELELQVGPFRIRGNAYNFEEKIREMTSTDKFITIHNGQLIASTQEGQPFLDFYNIFLNPNPQQNIFGVNLFNIDLMSSEINNFKSIGPDDHPQDLTQSRKEDDDSWSIGPKTEE